MRNRLHVGAMILSAHRIWDRCSQTETIDEFLIDLSYYAYQGVVQMSIDSYPDDEGTTAFREAFIRAWTDPEKGYEPYLSWEMERRHAEALWEYRKIVGRDNWFKKDLPDTD